MATPSKTVRRPLAVHSLPESKVPGPGRDKEGAASVIDVAHHGKKLGYVKAVSKTDIIAFDKSLSHVYLPGAESGTMAILGLSPAGDLSVLGVARAAHGSKCVVVDDRHTAYVCDPEHGQLLMVNDPFPATK